MAEIESALQTSGSTDSDIPAADGAFAPTVTSDGDNGIGQAIGDQAQLQLDQAAQPTELDTILQGIPESDDDLTQYAEQELGKQLISQRGQLRVLQRAVGDLQPLSVYKQFGNPAAVKGRLEIARLLYSPVLDGAGKPVRDPVTQTSYVTTKPLIEYLDKNSPGMPEQLLVDLLAYATEVERNGRTVRMPMIEQVFQYYKLDLSRLTEYQQIDTLIARTTGAITPEELAEIPAEYHAAYRIIPASIRNAWKSLDPADATRMLEDYKAKLDDAAEKQERTKANEAANQRAIADHQLTVAKAQDVYLNTVRRERTASLIQSLAKQVTFSADPVTNKVLLGSLAASMAQLLDPAWRFVVVEEMLTPLGLKLDHTFDAVLNAFDSNAAESVAQELAGERDRAIDTRDKSVSAADQLMAKIWPIALKVAKQQGATVTEKAANQADALAAAAVGRTAVNGTAPDGSNGILPAGMRPGTREAVNYLAEKTGYYRPN